MRRNLTILVLCAAFILPGSVSAQQDIGGPPAVPPLAKVDFPKYETKKLSNGLTVYALQHTEQPVLAVRLLINAGAEYDPENVAGVASMTASLLTQGTKTRTATQIAETIDRIGGTLGASADMESTVISAAVLKEHATTAFELMTDVLKNPAFSQEELDRLKMQALSNLSANMEEADYIANVSFNRALYGTTRYGHPEDGTLNSVQSMTRDEIVKFHDAYYAPNISALVIAGDMAPEEAFKFAEKYFGDWKKQDVPQPPQASAKNPEKRKIIVIDKPDAVQTEIRVGKLTVARKDPDYFNILITSYILGGSSAGRLNTTLRVERGLTYGAYATITPRRGQGNFYSTTSTRTEKTVEALSLIIDEMSKLRQAAPPAQELKDAQTFVIGSFPLSIELPANLATRLTTVFMYDLGPDYLATYRDKLAAVTAADVLKVSRDKLSPDDTTIVLVGKAADFKDALKVFGDVTVIPVDKLDLDKPF